MSQDSSIRSDAINIWKAGVAAVDSTRLVAQQMSCDSNALSIAGHLWSAELGSRICVVGAGKAGAGMAQGIEDSLSPELLKITSGWVNVPNDCVQSLRKIKLHGGRPAGVNEPTQAGVLGTQEILKRVGSLTQKDLCVVLISGGGSALLPAPIRGISLEQKLQVTRNLMNGGATIDELNCVRRALSSLKGGGLLRACHAGMFVTLIISDVIGNPLETIASGPTVQCAPDPVTALAVLNKIASRTGVQAPHEVSEVLKKQINCARIADPTPHDHNLLANNIVIGDNSTAVSAACQFAKELGYQIDSSASDQAGIAREVGRELAETCLRLKQSQPRGTHRCIITGGEPIVELTKTNKPQKGGRNQELVLAAAVHLWNHDANGIAILSGGTDGEDGPTDAAGACIDQRLIHEAKRRSLAPEDYLIDNNSYPFFQAIDGLLMTGPTHTNVMDLRVALIET